MNKSKDLEIKPYFDDDNGVFNEHSWVIVVGESASDDEVKFFYVTPEKAAEEELTTLKDFVSYFLENHDYEKTYDEKTAIEKDGFYSETHTLGEEDEDFDEDSGKSWKVYNGYALIVEGYKGGISKEDLPKLQKNMLKDLDDEVSNTADAVADTAAYNKDPYKYYGVSRRDFM